MTRRLALPLAFALLAAAVGLGGFTARETSPTFDEPITLAAGAARWLGAPAPLNREHPPLGKLWVALPAALGGARIDAGAPEWPRAATGAWQAQMDLAWRFLYEWNAPRGDALVRGGRAMVLLLLVALGLMAWRWGREIGGDAGGLCALGLVALSPTLLAHGSLATLDLPLATAYFAVFFAARGRPGARTACLTGLALGAAALVKATGWVAAPALVFVSMWRDVAARQGVRSTLTSAISCALALAVVHAAYGFAAPPALTPWPDAPLLVAASALLPPEYVQGMAWQWAHGRAGHYLVYLGGHVSADGFAAYYPLAFLLKSSLPELCALAAAAAVWIARTLRRAAPPAAAAAADPLHALLPGLVFFAFIVFTSRIQIGVRYLLPALPLLLTAAGGVLGRLRPAVPAALVAAQLAASAVTAPDFIASFNAVAGGVQGGRRHLSDSNVDWGQDLARLAAWLRERPAETVHLSYFGSADPRACGIRFHALPSPRFQTWYRQLAEPGSCRPDAVAPGDLVIVSVTNQHGLYLERPDCFHWLRDHVPVHTIGGSLLVYRVAGAPVRH